MSESESWFDYGRRFIHDTYVDGGSVLKAAKLLENSAASLEGANAYDGAIVQAMLMLTTCAKGGVPFSIGVGAEAIGEVIIGGDYRLAILRYRSLPKDEAKQWQSAMFLTLDALQAGGGVTFQRFQRAQEIQEKPEKPAAPIQVELVSMPIRKTVSAVSRDDDGKIVATTLVESDIT